MYSYVVLSAVQASTLTPLLGPGHLRLYSTVTLCVVVISNPAAAPVCVSVSSGLSLIAIAGS